jgi:hypothetical protein
MINTLPKEIKSVMEANNLNGDDCTYQNHVVCAFLNLNRNIPSFMDNLFSPEVTNLISQYVDIVLNNNHEIMGPNNNDYSKAALYFMKISIPIFCRWNLSESPTRLQEINRFNEKLRVFDIQFDNNVDSIHNRYIFFQIKNRIMEQRDPILYDLINFFHEIN